jgi:hypothetical protein
MMKKSIVRKRTIAGMLSLLLLLPSLCAAALAAEASPLLLADVTWDMTPEAVMEAEGMGGADTSAAWTTGAQYVFNYPAENGEPARQVLYVFMAGQLITYSCTIHADGQTGEPELAQQYDILLARLGEKYGEPTQGQTQATAMLTAMFASVDMEGSVVAYAVWDLGDGTVIYLENREGNYVSYAFINTAVLSGIAG